MDPENHPLIADAETRPGDRQLARKFLDERDRINVLPADQQIWARALLNKRAAVAETLLEQIEAAEAGQGGQESWRPAQTTMKMLGRVNEELRGACREHGLNPPQLSWSPVESKPTPEP